MKRILAMLVGVVSLWCVLPAIAQCDDQLHHRPIYTLHTGDVIVLNYRYTPEFNQTVTVQPDGYVNLNIVGRRKRGRAFGRSGTAAHRRIWRRID